MPEFYAKLRFQQRLLTLLLALMLGFAVLGLFSLCVLLAEAVNSVSPIPEFLAWRILIGLGLASFALAVVGLLWLALRRPRARDLARLVEERNPELKETLTTAMEIQDRGGPTNSLEEALFRDVENRCAEINLKRDALPRMVHPGTVLLLVALGMVSSDFAGKSEFVMKARFYQLDRIEGEATGLMVKPGDAEIPIASDLTVSAEITRWEREPFIVYQQAGEEERYPMTISEDGPATFTFFGVDRPLAYRVETPSLRSPWYTVNVYDPPRIDSVQLKVTPPAYTREDPTEFSRLVDLHMPEGSEVSLSLISQEGVSGSLRVSGEGQPMQLQEGSLESRFVAKIDGDYQVVLKNSEGRQLVTPSFELDVIPDEPPVVEMIEPGKDTKSEPGGAIPYGIYAGDDYGLSKVELHLSVSGLTRPPQNLFEAGDEIDLEKEILGALETAHQNAEHGDIISYYAVAYDNREPEPQSVRSDVFFIEVLMDVPQQESEGEGPSEGSGERDEINLRAIIVELKRLMREAHAAAPLMGERRAEAVQALATGIAETRKETGTALEKLTRMFLEMAFAGNDDGRAMADLLVIAMESMVEAERLANEDKPESVSPPLAEALSNLLIVESFAKSQPQMQSQSSGSGQPSDGQSQSESESEQQGQQGEQQQMGLGEMQEALEDLNRLVDEQSALNSDYQQANGQSLSEAELDQFLGTQTEIVQEAAILSRTLKERLMEPTYKTRQALKQAQGEMRSASKGAQQGDMSAAERGGLRARDSLMQAAGLLDGLIQQQAAGSIAGLSQQAGALAAQQEEARQASEGAEANGADSETAKELREEQESLRQDFQKLLAQMEREAVNLESLYPEAGQALGQAARNAKRANTEGEMQRAANALLYERFGRAGRHQGESARQLEELQASLNQAVGELPAMSEMQLRQLAEQISEARREVSQGQPGGEQSGEGESGQTFSKLGKSLGEAGEALSNEYLVDLGQNLEAAQEGDGVAMTQARLAPALDQAARIIQDYLRQQMVSERLQLNRTTAPPPEQYRRLVEEYFKNLAEEQ